MTTHRREKETPFGILLRMSGKTPPHLRFDLRQTLAPSGVRSNHRLEEMIRVAKSDQALVNQFSFRPQLLWWLLQRRIGGCPNFGFILNRPHGLEVRAF